jgi:hypothetical protein
LPVAKWGEAWKVEIDTRDWPIEADTQQPVKAGDAVDVEARSVVVLCRGS